MKNKLWILVVIFIGLSACRHKPQFCSIDLVANFRLPSGDTLKGGEMPNMVVGQTVELGLDIYNAYNTDCEVVSIPQSNTTLVIQRFDSASNMYELIDSLTVTTPSFESGKRTSTSFGLEFNAAGLYKMSVCLDINNTIPETNELNNCSN